MNLAGEGVTQEQPRWQRFAGSVAENYQRHLVPAIFEPWARDLVDLAAPRPGERVLDVACGPGVISAAAAAAARSPFSLWDIGELRHVMAGAGLHEVEVHSPTKMLRFSSPAGFVSQYAWASPIAAALGEADASVLDPVIRDVAEALTPYLHEGALSFPIENHLAQAVRPSSTADS